AAHDLGVSGAFVLVFADFIEGYSFHRLALQGVLTSSMPLLRRATEEISKPLLCVLIHFAFPAIQLYEPLGFIVFVDPVECRKN
ncbi:hypothetical protein JTM16_33815, partial [Pseudomonas aeruginosa]|nr:hypothetical protein [Pseudomonas aeruginosa]